MKKKYIITLAVIIFIGANVATYLFAQGKVKVVEKIIPVLVERDSHKTDAAPERISGGGGGLENAAEVPKFKSSGPDFNDSDYFPDNSEYYTAERDIENQDKIDTPVDVKAEEACNIDESQEEGGHLNASSSDIDNAGGGDNPQDISDYAEPVVDEPVADEGIPIPQLPLFDTDFEVDIDVGGHEYIALPQLPDISLN